MESLPNAVAPVPVASRAKHRTCQALALLGLAVACVGLAAGQTTGPAIAAKHIFQLAPVGQTPRSLAGTARPYTQATPTPIADIVPNFGGGGTITYTCDPSIEATAPGTCNYLNTTIAGLYASTFSNANANIYITFGITGLGESVQYLNFFSYSTYLSALTSHSSGDAVDLAALASLPASEPAIFSGGEVNVTTALGQALGLSGLTGATSTIAACTPGTAGCYNGVITITTPANLSSETGSTQSLYFRQNGGTQPSTAYDFYSIVEHETDEILGTSSCVSTGPGSLQDGCGGSIASAVDLFRYSAASTRVFISTTPGAYFSYNSGTTNVAVYNTLANGEDYADWATNCKHVQDAIGCLGGSFDITNDGGVEISVLDAVGFNRAAAAATYLGGDILTQGTWTGFYGGDGYLIANGASAAPSYASVSFTGDGSYTWTSSTTDPRALQTSNGSSSRIASTYYSAGSFNIKVNLTDGNAHRVALYLLDWDSSGRAETISILNASTNAVLSTQSFSNFHNGVWASWNINGNVIIQVTDTAGANAVVAGVFFDPVPAAAPATAKYGGLDVTTQGTWTGVHGADGNIIATETAVPPAYAAVSVSGAAQYVWSASTSDPRGLQVSSGSGARIASTYYASGSFTINVSVTDGNTHRVALYLLDWDGTARAETITVNNANTHVLLDTENYSNFHGGVYAMWDITGSVTIVVTDTAGANAVVAGLFFSPTPATTATVSYLGTDTSTQGAWTGKYGSTGQVIANGLNNPPGFATLTLAGEGAYTWNGSTTDPRALQTSSGATSGIASTYYASGTFTMNVNLTDGNTHKVSLYLLDWDTATRAETISIIDATSHELLSTQSYSSFHNGDWAVWNVKGNVIIQVTDTGGATAVVSGVFFD